MAVCSARSTRPVFEFGDVSGRSSKLLGSGASGPWVRGHQINHCTTPSTFDSTRFEGDLQAGWEAEIYRKRTVARFSSSDGSQRYIFENVQLVYGDNQSTSSSTAPRGRFVPAPKT